LGQRSRGTTVGLGGSEITSSSNEKVRHLREISKGRIGKMGAGV